MSWFWGSSPASDEQKQSDTIRKLDPDLKDFLAKEAPSKYEPNASDYQEEKPSYRSQLGIPTDSDPGEAEKPPPAERPLPKESLFQDGRYKHLWATYRPQAEVENAGKSDAERLTELIASYKDRKASISRAALENCAEEQWNVHECFRHGGLTSRMTMCKAENRAMERCYTMQSRFLRALGYTSLGAQPDDKAEAIQMHAHDLYHRMLEQERLIKEAKDQGLQPPEFDPILPERKPAVVAPVTETLKTSAEPAAGESAWDQLPAELKGKTNKKKFNNLSVEEQDLERKAAEGEVAADLAMAQSLQELHMEQRRNRLRRRAAGRERMSDKIGRWFDMRDWTAFDREEMEKIRQEAKTATESTRGE